MNERSLRKPAAASASLMTSQLSGSASRLLAEERRFDVTSDVGVLALRGRDDVTLSRVVSPIIDLDRVAPNTVRLVVVGVCEPDADVTERR